MNSHAQLKSGSRAVVLSAFVCPGLGQMVQRRILVGILFLMGFILSVGAFALVTLRLLFGLYAFAAGFNDPTVEPPNPNIAGILLTLSLSTGIYVANIIDAWMADRRRRRARATFANVETPE